MSNGYEALRTGAAWLDLSSRGTILAAGEDRARLLHALTTNHIQQLEPGGGCYAFFLNAQGRILGDVNLLCRDNDFVLDVEPETLERLYRHIDHYIIADDVTIEDATGRLAKLAVEGPNAGAVLAGLGVPVPGIEYAHLPWKNCMVANLSFTGAAGFRIFCPIERKTEWIGQLESAGAIAAGLDEARVVRLENAKPRYGEDISEATLPQETQQTKALHFNKGCYLGQEIVERIRSRGHVNRLLMGLRVNTTHGIESHTRLIAEGKEAGEITSAAFSPALGKVVALGYVRAPSAQPNTMLAVGEHEAQVLPLHT